MICDRNPNIHRPRPRPPFSWRKSVGLYEGQCEASLRAEVYLQETCGELDEEDIADLMECADRGQRGTKPPAAPAARAMPRSIRFGWVRARRARRARYAAVVRRRLEGASFGAIGTELDLSTGRVQQLHNHALHTARALCGDNGWYPEMTPALALVILEAMSQPDGDVREVVRELRQQEHDAFIEAQRSENEAAPPER